VPTHIARSRSRLARAASHVDTTAHLTREAGASTGRGTINRQPNELRCQPVAGPHGNVGGKERRANGSNREAIAIEELIAHVLGRAHRKAVANNAPDEARAILHVAHAMADGLAETDPLFDSLRFIEASTQCIIAQQWRS
jgi:hypothetical protein